MAVTASTASVSTRRQLPRRWRDFAPLTILVLLLIIVAVGQPAFFSSSGLTVLGTQTVPVLLLALGQSVVMMVGAIDLASASLAVFSAIVVATALPGLGVGAPIFTLLLGGVLGGVTGFLTAFFQIPSFAVTLGALGVWQALALVISNSTTVYVDKNAGAISWLTDYGIANIPSVIIVTLLAAVGLWLLLRYTTFGRATRAVGLNERSALLGGQSAIRTKVLAFALSGAFAAAAGIALTAQQGTATASGLGVGLLLPGIAAAVAGGVAITGGIGNPLNVIVGALIVSLIPIGSAAIGVDPRIQQIVYGAIVILAVMATIDRSRSRVIK